MKKSYLISIKPEWAVKILKKEKIYEIRRKVNREILEALDSGETVEMYMYETFGKQRYVTWDTWGDKYPEWYGYEIYKNGKRLITQGRGKVVAKLTIDGYEEVLTQHHIDGEQIERVLKKACIEHDDLDKYVGDKEQIITLHISKVEIFDEPMKLGEFVVRKVISEDAKWYGEMNYYEDELKRPFQNMGKVWVP